MLSKPTIVVVTYNRPNSLLRLLNSITSARYDTENIDLIISVDKSDNNEVYKIAENYIWKQGNKEVIVHQEHLGLKSHILFCGDLTQKHESVLILEDDLMVSPYFYSYAQQSLDFYKNDTDIAGISLYNYQVAESCFYPFIPIDDGSDVYFMQVASSWGQIWTKYQWQEFRNWLKLHPELVNDIGVPDYIFQWGENSWKKHFIHYLTQNNKYFVFPRISLTTNFEEPGTNAKTKNVFHVPLQLNERKYSFIQLINSKSVYDAWFEILPQCLNKWCPDLKNYDYSIDFYSIKRLSEFKKYVLTTRTSQKPIKSFSREILPFEANIALNQKGVGISLYERMSNQFELKELGLRNYLKELNIENDPLISIVIPVLKFNENYFNKTLESIIQQTYLQKKLVIVLYSSDKVQVEKLLSYCNLEINLITFDLQSNLSEMLSVAFKQINEGIITWMNTGTILSKEILLKISEIFKSNRNLNWIRGINDAGDHPEDIKNLSTKKYRLIPSQAYIKLLKNDLDLSMELDFFNSTCYKKIESEKSNMADIFYTFITSYQLNIVVLSFGQMIHDSKLSAFDKGEFDNLKNKLVPYSINISTKQKAAEMLIKLPIFNKDISEWFNPILNNYPFIIRFDKINNSFFFSKS